MKVQQLNTLIKFYASQIWKRIEELDRKTPKRCSTQVRDLDPLIQEIKDRHKNYVLRGDRQVEYVRKMNERILQILSFFKWKSRHQFLINIIEQNIQAKLNALLEGRRLGEIINFIVESVEPGSLIKQKQQRLRPKSRAFLKDVHPETTKEKRKAVSVLCAFKPEPKTQKLTAETLQTLYYGMNIDKQHLLRFKESSESMKRDIMKRNQVLLQKLRKREKSRFRSRMRTEPDVNIYKRALKELDNGMELNKKKNNCVYGVSKKMRYIRTSNRRTKLNNQNVLQFEKN